MFNYEYAAVFQERKKLVPQTVYTLYQSHIKMYLESFESIYHLGISYN